MHASREAIVPEKRSAGFQAGKSEGSWGLRAGVSGEEFLGAS